MKDILGNDLNVGDRVAWGAGGRYGWGTRTGTVTELTEEYGVPCVRVKADPRVGAGGVRRANAVVRVLVPVAPPAE